MSGIIPARAGFTGSGSSPATHHRDHPRSRGVYFHLAVVLDATHGSSPLARGLRHQGHRHGGGHSDHPRSRGVYERCDAGLSALPGSSPLARGLLLEGLRDAIVKGIIPARAGFTRRTSFSWSSATDHPRSRGVY